MSDKGNIPLMSGFAQQRINGTYDYGAFPNQPNHVSSIAHPGK